MKNVIVSWAAALGIALLASCAATRTHEAPGEYIDDAAITASVKSALIADPVAKAYQIEVETFRGVVQLSGFVGSKDERNTAESVAAHVKGVSSVHNNLAVRAGKDTVGEVIDDSVLTTRVKAALVVNPVTKARQINVTTERGVVQLSGFVDSATEKRTATEVARTVAGVHDVRNELETKSAP